jgi:hypothetical protein
MCLFARKLDHHMKNLKNILLLLFIGITSYAQQGDDLVTVVWDYWNIEFKIPAYLNIEVKSESEIVASGGGLKFQLIHVGQMKVREELDFFGQLIELDFADPIDIWPISFPAILTGGYFERVRVLIMAFNLEDQNAFAAISFFDEDNALQELEVLELYKTFKIKN